MSTILTCTIEIQLQHFARIQSLSKVNLHINSPLLVLDLFPLVFCLSSLTHKTGGYRLETSSSLGIHFYLLWTFCPHLGFFWCCFCFHYISAKFHLWWFTATSDRNAESCNRIPVITAFHSCCLSHHVFDQVNLWLAWVGFETAIFWQCSPGTVETQHLYPLRHGPWRAIKDGFFGLINPYLVFQSQVRTEFFKNDQDDDKKSAINKN